MSDTSDWMRVVDRLQIRVCAEFRIPPEKGVIWMRAADSNDPEIKSASVYRRHNRAIKCTIAVGTSNPTNVNVALLGGHMAPIFQTSNSKKVKVVIAGSFT